MNYIAELNAFDDWVNTHHLSTSAILLWYTMMQIANKAGWRESLSIPNVLIAVKSGLKPTSIKRAREELRLAGRITFDFQKGRKATIYKIISFAGQNDAHIEPQKNNVVQFADHVADQNEPEFGPQEENKEVAGHVADHVAVHKRPDFGPLYKLNKTKLNKDTAAAAVTRTRDSDFAEVSKLYQKNVHPFSGPVESEMLGDLVDTYGPEWTKGAIQEAIAAGVLRLSYITKILEYWKSVGGPAAAKQLHAQRKAGNGTTGKSSLADEARRILASWEARDAAAEKEVAVHGTG